MSKLMILLSLVIVGCGASTHSQFTTALDNSEEQSTLDEGDAYYDLIVRAVDRDESREASLLWYAAVEGCSKGQIYVLERKLTQDRSRYDKFVHMLEHHEHLDWERVILEEKIW